MTWDMYLWLFGYAGLGVVFYLRTRKDKILKRKHEERMEQLMSELQQKAARQSILRFLSHAASTYVDIQSFSLLTIGDAEDGSTIQIRCRPRDYADPKAATLEWVERSKRKVMRKSWVGIDFSGHDSEGDYRSMELKFKNADMVPALDAFAELASEGPSGVAWAHYPVLAVRQ